MNWVLILVLAVLVIGIIQGYRKGLLRIVYSMLSWILVLVCVAWSKPYINQYLVEQTNIYERIVEQCEKQIKQTAEKKAEETIQGLPSDGTDSSTWDGLAQDGEGGLPADGTDSSIRGEVDLDGLPSDGVDLDGLAQNSAWDGFTSGNHTNLADLGIDFAELGIQLPESVVDQILEKAGSAAGEMMEASGIYTAIAQALADFVIEGLAFFIAFIFASLLVHIISQLLGIVSHIPILKGINRTLGLAAGGIYSLFIIWIAFYIVALSSTAEWGAAVIMYIYQNPFLTYLYENNVIVTLLLHYF